MHLKEEKEKVAVEAQEKIQGVNQKINELENIEM